MWLNDLGLGRDRAVDDASRRAGLRNAQSGRRHAADRVPEVRRRRRRSTSCRRSSFPTPTTKRISRSTCSSATRPCRWRSICGSTMARRRATVRPGYMNLSRRTRRPKNGQSALEPRHSDGRIAPYAAAADQRPKLRALQRLSDIKDPRQNIFRCRRRAAAGPIIRICRCALDATTSNVEHRLFVLGDGGVVETPAAAYAWVSAGTMCKRS